MKKKATGIIYSIRHRASGKRYIGQTVTTLDKRIKQHMKAKSHIGAALRKHGREAFVVQVLHANVPRQNLNQLERSEIAMRNCMAPHGYNLTPGGAGILRLTSDKVKRRAPDRYYVSRHRRRSSS